MNRLWPSITELAAGVQKGTFTATELVEKSLKIIDQHQEFNAILATTTARAKQRAKQLDDLVQRGKPVGRLAGVPFIAKDNFLTFGAPTTAASNILKGFAAPYQATAIERLEAQGAICVAKANLDAFGHGGSTENSDFATTKNPHDRHRVAGGSSGGSAAAVVLEMAPFALGTDTGGSLRQPASFCGAVGLKPTYGLVSRSGVVAMASSTDCIGPLARTVEDAALVLDVMSGRDPLDSTSIDKDSHGYSLTSPPQPLKGQKIGIIKEYFGEALDPGVRSSIDQAVTALKQAGADCQEVSLPTLSLALACYYIICPAEISSNLSRYDGQHYGHHAPAATTLDQSFSQARSEGFGREAKRRIMIGTYVLSSGYYEAYYGTAQRVRTKLIKECQTAFSKVDFLAGPVAPTTAFLIGQNTHDPLQMYLQDILTVSANLLGIPAISIPAPPSQGLPVGLQLMAPQRQDRALLALAQAAQGVIHG